MNYQDRYIQMLQTEFNNRKSVNGHYSLRAFARDLDIEPSRLSLALAKKRGFSFKKAQSMISSLKWSQEEKEIFLDFVDAAHARSKGSRDCAITRVKQKVSDDMKQIENFIEDDTFRQIALPIHYQIIEALKLDDVPPTTEGLLDILDHKREDVENAIERLMTLGLINKQAQQIYVNEYVLTTSEKVPSMALRQHHSFQLNSALQAINEQSIDERMFSSLTISISKKVLPEIFNKIIEFRKEINEYITNHDNQSKTDVYCLSTQFFRCTKERK